MKKTISLLLIGTMIIMSGCGTKSTANKVSALDVPESRIKVDDKQPSWKTDTKDAKLSWFVNADWWNTKYGEDAVTSKMKEDLKLDVEFQAGNEEVLNTKFASGEIPDIVTVFNGSSVIDKASSWALPLNDLADKYDPYFYQVADKEVMNWYAIDGKTYGYPSFYNTQKDYDKKVLFGTEAFVVRKDIYEAIGSPDLSTPENVIEAAKKAKQLYPKVASLGSGAFGTGTGSWGETLQDLLGTPVQVDGKFYDRNADPEYLKWVKAFNEIYKLGGIPDDTFSDDEQIVAEKLSKGNYFMFVQAGIPQAQVPLQKWYAANPGKQYIAVDGPKDSKKSKPLLSQGGLGGWSVTYISKKCKDPQKAIELFTYMMSPYGRMVTSFGIEGKHYDLNSDGKAVIRPEIIKLRDENPDKFFAEYRFDDVWMFMVDTFRAEHGVVNETPAVTQMFDWTKDKLVPRFEMENINPDPGSIDARNSTNIYQNFATTLLSMVRAKDDNEYNSVWQAHLKFREANGWDNIVKIANEKIASNLKKLGK
ncbi:sugar ABC transporter substrate-binding protein [Clostridium sp. YIM B02515]|uniref:Sugar ABC transporter substrate-binding protein n=1 Tax=Clostridium rhizosphaerae TaxID=2803861 RepID=A0ABS1TER1_9CLOT|nr:sugar ABC transporter substrate-binding protein [Clostridium rhizosphaerae]MBL4937835.1 sugar ABC transporter substrate-binding protein [Clostridium rhizosphaerae]